MKKLLSLIAILFLGIVSLEAQLGQVYVNGYTKSNGTYVQGYYRTAPNYTKNDNWSTIGNVNPYTGTAGTLAGGYNSSYYDSYSSPSYSSYSNYSGVSYSTSIIYTTPSVSTYSYSSYPNSTSSYYISTAYSSSISTTSFTTYTYQRY